MKIAEALKNTYAIIKNKENWATGTLARNETGKTTASTNPDAFSFCALGAVQRVAVRAHVPMTALQRIAKQKFARSVESVNDSLGHSSVCALFEAAIDHYEKVDFDFAPGEVSVAELEAFLQSPS